MVSVVFSFSWTLARDSRILLGFFVCLFCLSLLVIPHGVPLWCSVQGIWKIKKLRELKTLFSQLLRIPASLPSTFPTFRILLSLPIKVASWVVQTIKICPQCRRPGFSPWVRKIPWRRKWQPTTVLLPGESHGYRSLMGCSPWGCRVRDD